MKKALMILDMQFGSTGKGQVAGTVGRVWEPDTAICANGPNAGHTYIWNEKDHPTFKGNMRVMHTVMPVAAVLPSVKTICIGPGAVIDLDRLAVELVQAAPLLLGKRLIIHPNASIVSQDHRDAEKSLVTIGSTMKGTAEASIAKLRREPATSPLARYRLIHIQDTIGTALHMAGMSWLCSYDVYDQALDQSEKILIEGAQGHSLSIHSPFYPHTTSRDVSQAQVWADCRMPAMSGYQLFTLGVCRTYPIRVANRVDERGVQVGYSGDCYSDQREITWESLGRTPELTTVTRLPRRIFTFSHKQLRDAIRINQPDALALTFCDYLAPLGAISPQAWTELAPTIYNFVDCLSREGGIAPRLISYGPTDQDMFEVGYRSMGDGAHHMDKGNGSTNTYGWLP